MSGNVDWKSAKRPIKDLGMSYVDADGKLISWGSLDAHQAQAYLKRCALRSLEPVKSIVELELRCLRPSDPAEFEKRDWCAYETLVKLVAFDLGFNPRPRPITLDSAWSFIRTTVKESGEAWVIQQINKLTKVTP